MCIYSRIISKRVGAILRLRGQGSRIRAELDARNRVGGRVAIIDAKPSVEEAIHAAERLGIELTD